MKFTGWMGIGLVVAFLIGGAVAAVPGAANQVQSVFTPAHGNPGQPEPAWGSGNLCSSISYYANSNPKYGDAITCVSLVSAANYPLWWNFTEYPAETYHGTVTVDVYGSLDCINLNFHSFYWTLVIQLYGSFYSCAAFAGVGGVPSGVGSGVNIVVNSESDSLSFIQGGQSYYTNITSYGTTTLISDTQNAVGQNTTVTYIGTKPGFATCPSGITAGRVTHWSEVAGASYDTFSTVFVDGTNVKVVPPNSAYATQPMLPPDGVALGTGDLYGSEVTQTAPPGACAYLGV